MKEKPFLFTIEDNTLYKGKMRIELNPMDRLEFNSEPHVVVEGDGLAFYAEDAHLVTKPTYLSAHSPILEDVEKFNITRGFVLGNVEFFNTKDKTPCPEQVIPKRVILDLISEELDKANRFIIGSDKENYRDNYTAGHDEGYRAALIKIRKAVEEI